MSRNVGFAADPVALVFRHVSGLFDEGDQDMLHQHYLPDGYNCHSQGVAVVVAEDVQQVDGAAHTRDLVRVSVYGPDHAMVRQLGKNLYTALTQGVTGVGLGVSRSRSTFFGAGPSFQPTGFVSTMSVSVGIGRLFAQI